MSRERDVRSRMSDDDVIVGAMADAARRICGRGRGAGTDAGGVAPPAGAARARVSRPPWRGLLVAGAGVAAVVALVLVARGVQRGRPLTYVVAKAPPSRTATSAAAKARRLAGAVLRRHARRPRPRGARVGAVARSARRPPACRGGRGALRRRPPAARRLERRGRAVRRVRDRHGLRRALVGQRRGDRGPHAIGFGAGRRAAAPRARHPARRPAPDGPAGEQRAADRRCARRRRRSDAPSGRRSRRRRRSRAQGEPAPGGGAALPSPNPRPRPRRRRRRALPPAPLRAVTRRRRRAVGRRDRARAGAGRAAPVRPAVDRAPRAAARDPARLGAAHLVAARSPRATRPASSPRRRRTASTRRCSRSTARR